MDKRPSALSPSRHSRRQLSVQVAIRGGFKQAGLVQATAPSWRAAAKRRAIAEWRDEYQLRAAALVNDAAIAAMPVLEQQVSKIDALSAWFKPDVIGGLHMRSLMAERVAPAAATLIHDARAALGQIDEGFASLSAEAPHFPIPAAEPPPAMERVEQRSPTTAAAAAPTVFAGALARAEAAAERVMRASRELRTAAALRARDFIGLHEMLRESARQEILRCWTGPATGDDQPYLARLDAVIDTLADSARTTLEAHAA